MATRVSYPAEVKMKAIEMRLAGVPVKQVMEELCIRNVTQLKTWMKWYRNGELHRFQKPVGKQYTYRKYQKMKVKQLNFKQKIGICDNR